MDFSQFYKHSQSTFNPKKPEKPKPSTEQKLSKKYYKNQNLERMGIALKSGNAVVTIKDVLYFVFDFYKEISESYNAPASFDGKERIKEFMRQPRVRLAIMSLIAQTNMSPVKIVKLFSKTYLSSLIYLVKNKVTPSDLSSLENFLGDKMSENPMANYPNKEQLGHYVTAESKKHSERRAV